MVVTSEALIVSPVSQNLRRSRDTLHMLGVIYHACTIVLLCINQHTKCEVRTFDDSKDMFWAKFTKRVT